VWLNDNFFFKIKLESTSGDSKMKRCINAFIIIIIIIIYLVSMME